MNNYDNDVIYYCHAKGAEMYCSSLMFTFILNEWNKFKKKKKKDQQNYFLSVPLLCLDKKP